MLTGSVSAASELLHVSQPAVSKVLANAARQSGFTLFERIRGRLVPTPEARELYADIEGMWRSVEKVRDTNLVVSVLRNRSHPMSLVEKAFVEAFDKVWHECL
ncbi:hypothetical protein BH09PSE5_BH09PSE5_30770 [soil metagenome]